MRSREELESQETVLLAPYAVYSAHSRGRHIPEPEDPFRTDFQRDRDRIIHSSAYRRLGNKTQVFITTEGEYYHGGHLRVRSTYGEGSTFVCALPLRLSTSAPI